jgi:hypothetical protein
VRRLRPRRPDVTPRRRKTINRRQDYVERGYREQYSEIPRVIDVEETKVSVEFTRSGTELLIVFAEARYVILHYQHPAYAAGQDQHQHNDSKSHGTH